jgi:hypothetical protein
MKWLIPLFVLFVLFVLPTSAAVADDRFDEIAIVQDYISRPAYKEWKLSATQNCDLWRNQFKSYPAGKKIDGFVQKVLIACDAETKNGAMNEEESLAFFEILFDECSQINTHLLNDIHGLNRAEKYSICLFSNLTSSEVNSNLRKNQGKPLYLPNLIRILDSALSKLPDFRESIVSRMLNLSPTDINSYVVGKKVLWYAYTSSSFGKNLFKGNVKFLITSKFGKDIHEISGLPAETEVLFARSSEFLVKAVNADSTTGLTVIELEQLN